MGMVVAQITTSLDGYITGPADGPGCPLGAAVGGRATYDAVEAWGGSNPWAAATSMS